MNKSNTSTLSNKFLSILNTLKQHRVFLENKYKIKKIGVFGSFARGEAKRKSDIDIIVDFYEVPDLLEFINLERYLQRILKRKIDLIRKPVLRKELKKRILKEVIFI
jgi:hypothetical protein